MQYLLSADEWIEWSRLRDASKKLDDYITADPHGHHPACNFMRYCGEPCNCNMRDAEAWRKHDRYVNETWAGHCDLISVAELGSLVRAMPPGRLVKDEDGLYLFVTVAGDNRTRRYKTPEEALHAALGNVPNG